MDHVAVLVRGLNMMLVHRDMAAGDTRWPTNDVTHRGGGFNPAYATWFGSRVGQKFRCAWPLATSFSRHRAEQFMSRHGLHKAIMWTIEYDMAGKTDPSMRCKHVALIEKKYQTAGDEQEYLFVPYSVFTVLEVDVSAAGTTSDPYRIRLRAATDNAEEDEELPLSPWN